MVAYQHPTELNPLQQYRQASNILKGTSRATNRGWYESPLDLEFQVHLRTDGTRLHCWIYRKSTDTWSTGPELSEELILDTAAVPSFATDLVKYAKSEKADAVGVILHLADEFATTELKPELDNPGALPELRSQIESEPSSVLEDSSLSPDDTSWRLIPYPAAGSESIATAVTLSRRAGDFVDALREFAASKNFPIATLALSSPLVGLLALPSVRSEPLEKPFIAVLPYARFTVLAFFNPHGDLQLLRTLQHRGMRGPSNLRHAASTTAAALEMSNPDVLVLPFASDSNPQLVSDLQIVFDRSEIREANWPQTPYFNALHPALPPELLISVAGEAENPTPLGASHTFSTLRSEGWAFQDFLPIASATAQVYPSRGEMKLLQLCRHARLAMAVVAAGFFAWLAFGLIDIVRRPEWTFRPEDASVVNGRLGFLGVEKKKLEHWDNLLDDRSKGWAAMEMLARFFPEKGGFLIKSYSHKAAPESVSGQAQAGFVKEWRISGLAREESLQQLSNLNTRDGITAAFGEIARITGNPSFQTDLPSRSVLVNVKTLENNAFKPIPPDEMNPSDESTYPFMFDLTITQRFESTDPLALNTSKAP